MPKHAFSQVLHDALEGLPHQLEHHTEAAGRTLDWVIAQADSKHKFTQVLQRLLEALPLAPFLNTPELARRYAHIACRAREAGALERLLCGWPEGVPYALKVYQAWLLQFRGHPGAALEGLHTLEPSPYPYEHGLHLRLLGEIQAALGQPLSVWQPCFEAARPFLRGTALGLCLLTEASWLYSAREVARARHLWAEALPLIRSDVYYSAWWRYNLGITYLREGEISHAERHFTELEKLCRREEAAPFRVCAQVGFAAARRSLGELERALACSRQALRYARQGYGDPEDLEAALWGIGLALRLLGYHDEALGYLLEARGVQNAVWLSGDLAVCCLHLKQLEQARHHLQVTQWGGPRHLTLHHLVQAELCRQAGDVPGMETALAALDFAHPSLREEAPGFSALLEQARSLGYAPPLLEPRASLEVRVKAEGTVQVWVNGREVSLGATGLPAQALVYLLESRGRAALGDLTTALFESRATQRDAARKALHPHLVRLRTALGWPESVQAQQGAVQLDPRAIWRYDIDELRAQGVRPRSFMQGVGSEWVLEKVRELEEG